MVGGKEEAALGGTSANVRIIISHKPSEEDYAVLLAARLVSELVYPPGIVAVVNQPRRCRLAESPTVAFTGSPGRAPCLRSRPRQVSGR